MTKKTGKKTIVTKQLKKGARKLVAALPLAALLVEEVRAAEGLSDERLEELALQEELKKKQADTLLMAGAADAPADEEEEVVADADADADADAQPSDADAAIDGADPRSGDVLLALNDTQDAAASSSVASDATGYQSVASGTGGSTNIVTNTGIDGFELSGLPLLAAVSPVGIAAMGALGLIAANNTTAADVPAVAPNEFTAEGTHLNTSLKDLQAAGVNAVNVAAGLTDLHVALGAAGTLSSAGLPVFGDSNLDGTLSGAEDAALNVTLDIANAGQLAEFAGLSGLSNFAAAGIDNVQFSLADQAALTSLLGDTNLASELLSLNNAGLTVNTIDMAAGQTAHLSLADAGTLVADGLHFASGDQVSVDLASADGTHLTTSLQNLQALGVTTVNTAAAAGDVHIGFGASDTFNAAGLPTFTADNAVTLDAANTTQLHAAAGAAGALATAGIDHVNLNLADQAAFDAALASGNTIAADLGTLNAAGLSSVIDMASDAVTLSLAQAQAFNAQGIDFAANDVVTVNADGTHMAASLQNLQALGVNAVSTAAGDLHISLGSSDTFNAAGLPTFTNDHQVTLGVHNIAQLAAVAGAATDLATAGIDHVQFNFADQAVLNSIFDNPTQVNADMAALNSAGVVPSSILDMESNFAHLSETQAVTLIDSNLGFVASDNVSIDLTYAHATGLSTSLHDAMHNLGVDTITVTDGANISSLSELATSLNNIGVGHLGLTSTDLGATNLANQVYDFDWANSGIDFVVNVDNDISSSLALLEQGVDVFDPSAPASANWGDLITALQQSGLGGIEIESAAPAVTVSDDLTAALYDAGMLHALPDANVTLTADAVSAALPSAAVLETSLKAMAELGVDTVDTTDAVQKVYVELGANADVAAIIHGFTVGSALPTDGLFEGKEAGLVVDQATFDTFSQGDVSHLLSQLSDLGFTEIDVLDTAQSYGIVTTVAQAPVLSQAVTLGAADEAALHDVFDTDIKDKTIG